MTCANQLRHGFLYIVHQTAGIQDGKFEGTWIGRGRRELVSRPTGS